MTQPLRLTDREAAVYMGVSVSLLRKWRRVNRGPAWLRLSRCVRYDTRDLDAYLKAHRRQTEGGR